MESVTWREEDRIAKCWAGRGTVGRVHAYPGVRQKRVEFEGVNVYRIAEGKVVSLSGSSDTFTLLQQLDAIPAMAATPA